MLGKLIRYEFQATSRTMGPLYLVVLALSLGGNFSIRLLSGTHNWLLSLLSGLILTAYGIAIAGVLVMSVVLMVNRFRTNLMSDEGYVMFSLPVSVHQLVWSKIIVSVVWFAATVVTIALSGVIVSFRVDYVGRVIMWFVGLFRELTAYYAINGAALLAEALVLVFLSGAAVCLLFYAAMAVGYSFARHKGLLSVAFFFAFQFATQLIASLSLFGLRDFSLSWISSPVIATHALMWISIAGTLVYGAVYYVITTFMLKKHLNLE